MKTVFTTALGSTYEVHRDGTTTRNKAARPEHPGEEGSQLRSTKTYYLDKIAEDHLVPPEGFEYRFIDHGDGQLSIHRKSKSGELLHRGTAKVLDSPALGLRPLELWDHEIIDGRNAYADSHIGNEITKIDLQPADRSTPTRKAEPPKIGDPA